MGLLGNGDDSLTSNTGWGMVPPMNSGADWGSSSSIGANTSTNCWQTPNSGARVSQIVSSNTVTSATNNEALSSSPKLSSSWAQAAGKGLMASSSNNANNSGNSQSNNVIIQSSSNNSNTGPVSSLSDRHSSIANNGPTSSSTTNNYSHESSYSAAINSGSNNQQQQSLNSNGTTASCSSNAFQTVAQSSGANNSSSSNEPSGNGGNKRAITTNINDLIGNISEDVRDTILSENWCAVINQESPWNLPPSPQSSPKDTSQWRCPVNSGTEIWENTVRHKKGGPPGASNTMMNNAIMTNNGNNGSNATISMHGGIGQMNGPQLSNATNSSQAWGQPPSNLGNWGEDEDTSNHWVSTINSTSDGGNTPLSAINNWSSNNNGQNNSSTFNWNGTNVDNNSVKNFDASGVASKTGSRKPWGNFETNDSVPEQSWDKLNENFGTWNADSNKKESGWDKDLNDSYKGPIDDGTSVWGNPVRQAKVSNWKETQFSNPASSNKNNFNGWNKGMANMNGVVNIAPNDNNRQKTEIPNRSWSLDASQQRKSPSWNDGGGENKVNGNCSFSNRPWIDSNSMLWHDPITHNHFNKTNKGHGSSSSGIISHNSWIENQVDTSHWGNNVMQNRHSSIGSSNLAGPNPKLSRDLIPSNNHFKNTGFKKDDADNTLRNNQMRSDDALKFKNQIDDVDLSRRTGQCALQSNDRSRLGAMMNAQNPSNVAGTANMVGNMANNRQSNWMNFAITQGLLDQQILSLQQSSNPQVMEIINEISQQIKIIRSVNLSRNDITTQMKYQQIKQNIANLQRQLIMYINSPQYMMARNNTGSNTAIPPQTPPNSIEFFKPGVGNGNMAANTTNDLSAFDFVQPPANQGSRLNSWKNNPKPDDRSGDFIRAPGPLSKQNSTSSNNNWSGFAATNDDANWSNADKSELPGSSLMEDYDFDYSKTWKTGGAKALDDDRSLFNLSNISKDPFAWNNNKPHILNSTDTAFASFSSTANPNTWSYVPPGAHTTPNMFDMAQQASSNKNTAVATAHKKNTWNVNAPDYINNDSLWSNSVQQDNTMPTVSNTMNKSRPPPGISVKMSTQNTVTPNSNVWSSAISNNSNSCEYLRIRNLTPQIDGPTLRTLCLQHGPLSQFQIDLDGGIAIVRYATREHAIKAQSALNNCPLGNTTLCADLPSNNEIQHFLNNLAQQQQSHLAMPWSNGNDASHSHTVTAGAAKASGNNQGQVGGANSQTIQSYQSQQTPQAAVVRGQQSSSYAGSNSLMVNSANTASTQNLPYGSNGSVLSSHSSSLPFGSAASNAANNSNKIDPSTTWNNPSSMMWDMSNSSSAATNLWSSSGFHTTDRSTPIQNFLPNDLLAGENN